MMFRGLCKVVAVAFVTNQVLTTIFTYAAQQLDSALPHDTIWLFSCVTSGLVTLWLQADARRAFGFACEKGFVEKSGEKSGDAAQHVQIAEDCPKRWLVILHIELNPAAMQA
jgi:phosphoribosyl-AMP cyclohydrolase